jgi:glycolate oxidase iron-sulfur subunit
MQVASALETRAAAAGTRPPAMAHTVEVLDASLRGLPVAALTTRAASRPPRRTPQPS